MRIQPINTNQQQTGFQAMKLPDIKIKPRVGKQLTAEKEQERNYLQAIMLGLAVVAASFTKCFIDVCNTKHKQAVQAEVAASAHNSEQKDTFQFK